MKTIWKFRLKMQSLQNVQLPEGAEVLAVQPQGDGVCLWALVEPVNETASRTIWIIGTGHEIERPDKLGKYIGTFQLHGGELVFHAFEAL